MPAKSVRALIALFAVIAAAAAAFGEAGRGKVEAAVIVSAQVEWAVVKSIHPRETYERTPYGEFFVTSITSPDASARRVVFFHGGWGKVAAAASTQYAVDRWDPPLIVNLGTCGGFEGAAVRFDVILATKTVIYDVIERMGNAEQALADCATTIDLGWLQGPDPAGVRRVTLVSADQDLDPQAIPGLKAKYGAVAGDWESGAIAWTAQRNGKRVLILRGVSDLVGTGGGEAYGNVEVFRRNAETVMTRLLDALPGWLARSGGQTQRAK